VGKKLKDTQKKLPPEKFPESKIEGDRERKGGPALRPEYPLRGLRGRQPNKRYLWGKNEEVTLTKLDCPNRQETHYLGARYKKSREMCDIVLITWPNSLLELTISKTAFPSHIEDM